MNVELSDVERRARIHAALGDPARLAIADALAAGDASPGEIAHELGMTSNLVAHHLNVLVEAGVIERIPSEHDRRRTYVKLRPAALAQLNPPTLPPVRRVVFVCTHNSARSQLAAALWTRGHAIPAASAGTRPAPRVHPRAVRTARRHGLRLDPTRTSGVDEIVDAGDLVVAVCDHVHETLPIDSTRLHWSVPDPVPVDTDEAFEAAYGDLESRVLQLGQVLRTGKRRG